MPSKFLPSVTLATVLAMPFALPVHAQQWADSIDVGVTASEITSAAAAQRYATVDADLTAAIAEALAAKPDNAKGGAKITVDLDEVALAAPFAGTPGPTTGVMAGTVSVADQGSAGSQRKFDLAVAMNQIMPYVPGNQDITVVDVSSDAVYQAVVKTFAAAVVDNLPN
ncbi:hypothetical protein [Falsirhodobacter sp. 20TX0035]|uniref:hypothetical protein n=1 Tax=Falsirhodobacter sp. 20TX0035 TaxID=3022019 RepID=UPI00232E99CC|nr:hypothetical protein [Falsirhodobacter sp. 20TX0035]MDB6453929.1 hypothetical protein [Falsirhodobacter sp. 20TX0035]